MHEATRRILSVILRQVGLCFTFILLVHHFNNFIILGHASHLQIAVF